MDNKLNKSPKNNFTKASCLTNKDSSKIKNQEVDIW